MMPRARRRFPRRSARRSSSRRNPSFSTAGNSPPRRRCTARWQAPGRRTRAGRRGPIFSSSGPRSAMPPPCLRTPGRAGRPTIPVPSTRSTTTSPSAAD
ncbi:MAG: hypothetical protein EBZ74_08325 [Planctomycetia bacterium]|nr:hypothetical protein [Planctomycetia bacterium]